MQRHAAIEQDGRCGDTKCVSELAYEEVRRGNVIDVGYRRIGGNNGSSSQANGPDAKALQENGGRQDDGGGGGRPDIADRKVGANQEQQSADERAHGTQAGNQHVQSELQTQPQAERVHRNKTACLQGAVVLDETQVLRHHIEAGAEERSHDQNHQKKSAQGSGANDHAQMKHRHRVFGAVVPPEKRDKENGRRGENGSNPVRLQPQIALAAAGGSFQAGERSNQQNRAPHINVALFLALKQTTWWNNFPD